MIFLCQVVPPPAEAPVAAAVETEVSALTLTQSEPPPQSPSGRTFSWHQPDSDYSAVNELRCNDAFEEVQKLNGVKLRSDQL